MFGMIPPGADETSGRPRATPWAGYRPPHGAREPDTFGPDGWMPEGNQIESIRTSIAAA